MSQNFTGLLKEQGIQICMDDKGCWRNNVLVERLRNISKYEEVYLRTYGTAYAAQQGLDRYLVCGSQIHPHLGLNGQTPE